jgi:hypothetical protein
LLDCIEIHGDITRCDYLWVPASRRDEITHLFA